MSHSSHLRLFALAALLTYGAKVQAQTPSTPKTEPSPWSELQQAKINGSLEIITVSEPGVRHKCSVKKITADQIECSGHLHKSVIYSRDEVQTVLAPGHKLSVWPSILIGNSIAGGIITGAVFLAMLGPIGIVAAVPVGLVGVWFGLFLNASAVSDNEGPGPERFLYLRHTTPSTTTLP